MPGHQLRQAAQSAPQNLVVITAPGVQRDHCIFRFVQTSQFLGLPVLGGDKGKVVHAGGNHADRPGYQFSRPGPLQTMSGHIVHTAVKTLRQPVQQSSLGFRQVDTSDANLGKSKLTGPFPNLSDELRAIETHLPIVKTLSFQDEGDTQIFAAHLAAQPALGNALIELRGDLGVGKTTLARHLLQAMGVRGRIKSPSYAIVEAYALASCQIWHFDFYRFKDPNEWEEAGFRDIFASKGLKLVEWPEKAEGLLPEADLAIHLELGPDGARQVSLSANSAIGQELIQTIGQRGMD